MFQELLTVLARYANGEIVRRVVEDWVLINLQSILASGDQEAIALANEVDALLVELGEGIVTETDILERSVALLREASTVRVPSSPEPLLTTGPETETTVVPNPFGAPTEVVRQAWAPA